MTKQTEALRMAIEIMERLHQPNGNSVQLAIQACKDALAETQEAVGYIDEYGNFENSMKAWMEEERNGTWTPVYTTPPSREWVGLSDEEVIFCTAHTEEMPNNLSYKEQWLWFARAIEKALREKNNG